MGDRAGAIAALRRAIELEPENERTRGEPPAGEAIGVVPAAGSFSGLILIESSPCTYSLE
jgi:hypothetical protein